MKVRLAEHLLWAGAIASLTFAVTATRRVLLVPASSQHPEKALPPAVSLPTPDSIAEAAVEIAELEPFGVVASMPNNVMPPPSVSSKPVLVLRGVVGGPPWTAILDGVPGQAGGIVVRAGDVVAELAVKSVHANRVVVRGVDTTWTLSLKP